jgi:protein-L-isoaspartate(D-aspartate) O-methyltransferase
MHCGGPESSGRGNAVSGPRGDADRFALRRVAMVRDQLRASGVRDDVVLEAFLRVPRERFVPERFAERAYANSALGIGHGQTISQPLMVAIMTAALELGAWAVDQHAASCRVLDVGTGSGYQAAILAELGASVVTVELEETLAGDAERRLCELGYADRILHVVADGSMGWPAAAPYAGIVVAAAAPGVPPPLLDQLADGARLVIPVGSRDRQDLHVVVRRGSGFERRVLEPCVFVPLLGRYGFPG